MNKANYKNENQSYPVSTDTFDFIQEQIELLAQFVATYGENVILKRNTATEPGIIVVNNEIMPLAAGQSAGMPYIQVVEEAESIQANSLTYENARIRRYAAYTATYTTGCLTADLFKAMVPVQQLAGKHEADLLLLQFADSQLAARLDTAESDISTVQGTAQQNGNAISTLQTQITTANKNITTNKTNIATNKSDIASLRADMDTALANLVTVGCVIEWYVAAADIAKLRLMPAELPYGFVPACYVYNTSVAKAQFEEELADLYPAYTFEVLSVTGGSYANFFYINSVSVKVGASTQKILVPNIDWQAESANGWVNFKTAGLAPTINGTLNQSYNMLYKLFKFL